MTDDSSDLPDETGDALDPAILRRFEVVDRVAVPDTWPGRASVSVRFRRPLLLATAVVAVAGVAASLAWLSNDEGPEVVASGAGTTAPTVPPASVPFECPVTVPPDPAFVPSQPWSAEPAIDDAGWFGSDDLWTIVGNAGNLLTKGVWWSANFPGGAVEENPPLTVRYERLDGDEVVVRDVATNAYTSEEGWFMIDGGSPGAGCWRATATYKGATLSFVSEVEDTTGAPVSPDGGIDGPLMFSAPWEGIASEGALIVGVIELDDGCLYVRGDSGERYPVLWPHGTEWQASPPGVVTPAGDLVPLGGSVRGGGGYHRADALEGFVQDPDALAMAARCADGEFREVAIVQGGTIDPE